MSKAGDGTGYTYTLHYLHGKFYRYRAYFQSKDAAWRVFWSLVVAKRTAHIEPYSTGWRVVWL